MESDGYITGPITLNYDPMTLHFDLLNPKSIGYKGQLHRVLTSQVSSVSDQSLLLQLQNTDTRIYKHTFIQMSNSIICQRGQWFCSSDKNGKIASHSLVKTKFPDLPNISSEYLQSIDPCNSSDTKRNACYFSLQYAYILS